MRQRTSRHRRFLAVCTTVALTFLGLGAITASQAVSVNPFDIDGDVPDADAFLFEDGFGNAQELGPLNSNTTKLGVIHSAAPPMLGTTNPNAQVDLRNVWLDTETSGTDTWLYFAWERDSNRGTGVIMYEFQQEPEPEDCDYALPTADLIASCNPWERRQPGDFIIVWDQAGQTINIILRTWSADPNGDLDGDGVFDFGEGLVLDEGTAVLAPSAYAAVSGDKFYGEAAINLTDTVFTNAPDSCLTIGNVIPGTVTGNSDTADYKDTVLADVADYLTITNCGAVTITKVTDPTGGTGTFDWTLERSGGGNVFYDDADATTDESQAGGTLTADGDSDTVIDLIAGTDYTLSEIISAGAYDLASITCDPDPDVTGDEIDVYPGGNDFTVTAGETVACTIVNELQQGTLVVEKEVVNDDGGLLEADDFSFQVDGGTATAFTPVVGDPLAGSNSITLDAGTYSVTEANLPVTGYDTSYTNSENAATDCTDLTVPAGGSVTCTITNDDQPATLVVEKVVVNDNGGTAVVTDFSYQVNGGSSTFFEIDASNSHSVDAGSYSVVEDAFAGYTTSYTNDLNAALDCGDLVIGNGETVTCTITNDDTKAQPDGTTVQTWVLHDSLTITGLRADAPDAADATATFSLFSDAMCAVQVGSDEVVDVSGTTAATATGVSVTVSGTYYWTVAYSGDQYNEAFVTDCGDEVTQVLAKDAFGGGRDDFAP
ncbi:hypothetical protein [Georgenia muralis]|uniref:SpaA-like prealbumin fold domain-containing protein n=1 Tax=Georgenia muralis TaxID=154117 RepID=A0A3N4Z5Z0_9MICO|nr:hypothetical protein [Georgenia muralis]RPF28799.1 hypothetical protein EDD32_3345 [Georgenia muralis]